ncbi:efflux RND transporter periplasmic adaptor subunit [Paenibacillus filicis]|uniref:Efflux RND transporter periplasmic adaptor subunit n=1 Tax=Paenibacillus filicis TaxID=669464 RepID=A0ABU9DNB3_9BACL
MTYAMKRQSKRNSAWTRVTLVGMVVLLSAAAAGCSAPSSAQSGAKTVRVAKVSSGLVTGAKELDADIVSSTQVNIVSKLGGDVIEVLKKKGDSVNQGDVLFRLDSSTAARNRDKTKLTKDNLKAQIDKTSNDIVTNKAVLRNSIEKLTLQIADLEKAYNNARNDFDAGTVQKTQVEKAESALKAARLDLDTAQKQLANLESTDALAPLRIQMDSSDLALLDIESTLNDFEVKSPISGVLTDFSPEAGMTVPQGYTAGVVQQLDPIKVHADVTEAMLKQLSGKQEIPFTVQGSNDKLSGKIVYVADVMSLPSKTYVVELSAPNPQRKLKPGMRVKLQLGDGGGSQSVLSVPNAALVQEGDASYAFAVVDDHVEKRKLTLGASTENGREVTGGLKDGELVVISGQKDLQDKDQAVVSQ